jgi:ATP-binding cassette subfamily B protein
VNLHQHSFSFFNNNFVGSLVKKVTRFGHAFESLADKVFYNFNRLVITTIIILAVLFVKNVYLGLGILAWLVIAFTVNFIFSKFKYRFDAASSEADSRNTALLADTVTNNANIKLFRGFKKEIRSFADSTDEVRRLRSKSWYWMEFFFSINSLLMVFLEVGMLYIGVIFWRKGMMTVGDFALLQAYIFTIMESAWQFGHLIQRTYEDFANAAEMTDIFRMPHDIVDVPNAKRLTLNNREVRFESVDFCYNQTRYVLKDFNLTIKPGEKVALVGPSGSGKSTILKLLLRMHDLPAGKIFIDGQNIARVTQDSLRSAVGLVPQDPILFHRSLFENIRYGRPNATKSEIIEAAKLAHCHEFIDKLPDKYETKVGERGIKLSGGERQRVAIARAILYNAPILVLDEATSSLDSESEKLIQEALGKLISDKTVVVVAHRLSTIMKMDRIIVMKNGMIAEEGTHDLLIKNAGGLYAKLWKIQAGGFIS